MLAGTISGLEKIMKLNIFIPKAGFIKKERVAITLSFLLSVILRYIFYLLSAKILKLIYFRCVFFADNMV